MKICSPQLGLAPKSTLGGEVFDRQILLGLAKSGVKIDIILPKSKPYDKNVKNWHLSFVPISHFPAPLYNLLIIPYLSLTYRRSKFDIIRIHQPQFIGLGCLLFKLFRPRVKLIATFHQFGESNFSFLSKTINNLWDHIICDSLAVKNKLEKIYQIPSKKITFVHNGVPAYLKPSAKNRKLISRLNLEGKIVLLFMGLFIDRKNPLFLLNVLARLCHNREDIAAIFWGQGPLKSQIATEANRLGITDKIRIISPLFGKEKNKIHNLADIFVHPALDEGFALAPLESMACAKPVVMAHAYSATEAVTDGLNGFLCQPNDLDSWSKRLKELIESPALREKMGKSSLAKVRKEFQWQLAVKKHLEVLSKLSP